MLCIDTALFSFSLAAPYARLYPIEPGPTLPEEIVTGKSGRMDVKMHRLVDDAITEVTTTSNWSANSSSTANWARN
jgi:hypothetical protein